MKGSKINREVLKKLSEAEMKKKCPTGGWVLKDLDYIRMKETFRFLKLSARDISKINYQLHIDVNFLMDQRFMDYSLLFVIKKVNNE